MSVINDMLRDLEARGACAGGGGRSAAGPKHGPPARSGTPGKRRGFWLLAPADRSGARHRVGAVSPAVPGAADAAGAATGPPGGAPCGAKSGCGASARTAVSPAVAEAGSAPSGVLALAIADANAPTAADLQVPALHSVRVLGVRIARPAAPGNCAWCWTWTARRRCRPRLARSRAEPSG